MSRKIICTKFFFLFVFLSSFLCGSMWNRTRASPIVQDVYKIILAFFWHKRAQCTLRPWQGRHVGEQRPWMPEILILISYYFFFFSLLLLLLYSRPINNVIIIFAHNNIVDITWLAYYYIIEYVHTRSLYLLLLIYTLRFYTDYFIVYDISFFRTHREIIIEFSFESIILLYLL